MSYDSIPDLDGETRMTWDPSRRRGWIEALTWVLDDPHRTRTDVRQKLKEITLSMGAPDSGPATSKKAARELSLGRAGSLRWKALECYKQRELTDEEVGNLIGHTRIWPRCSELRSMGLIEPTGEERLVHRTGLKAEVCRLTEAGKRAIA